MRTQKRKAGKPVHAKRLTEVMEGHGLSEAQIAVKSGLPPRSIADVRLGRTKTIRLATAQSLARALSELSGETYTAAWLRGEK